MSSITTLKYKLFPSFFYKRDIQKALAALKKVAENEQLEIYRDAIEIGLFKGIDPSPWYKRSQVEMLKALKGVSVNDVKGGLTSINVIYTALLKLPNLTKEVSSYIDKEFSDTISKEMMTLRLTYVLNIANALSFFVQYSQIYLLKAYGDMYSELKNKNPDIPDPLSKAEEVWLDNYAEYFFNTIRFIFGDKGKVHEMLNAIPDIDITNDAEQTSWSEYMAKEALQNKGFVELVTLASIVAAIPAVITGFYTVIGAVGLAKSTMNNMVVNQYHRNKLVVEALTLRAEQLRLEIAKQPNPALTQQLEKVESERIRHEKKIHDTEEKFGLNDIDK